MTQGRPVGVFSWTFAGTTRGRGRSKGVSKRMSHDLELLAASLPPKEERLSENEENEADIQENRHERWRKF